jgi:hypothetical protein
MAMAVTRTLEFTDEAEKELQGICRDTGCNSKEAIQNAFLLLRIYVQMMRGGKKVIGVKIGKRGKLPRRYTEISIPICVPDLPSS